MKMIFVLMMLVIAVNASANVSKPATEVIQQELKVSGSPDVNIANAEYFPYKEKKVAKHLEANSMSDITHLFLLLAIVFVLIVGKFLFNRVVIISAIKKAKKS